VIDRWRSRNPQIIDNPDFVSVVNDQHYDRVVGLIQDAVDLGATKREAAPDGESLPDKASRKIAPTLLTPRPGRHADRPGGSLRPSPLGLIP
jgi:coniferyl-aldehyde dehydrogenase